MIADVAEKEQFMMVPQTKKASMDVATMRKRQALERAYRKYNVAISPDMTASADVTLVVPWNVFTTGTYSVLEPGTVLRARVLETTELKGDFKAKKQGNFIMKPDNYGNYVIASNQISIDEFMKDQKGA